MEENPLPQSRLNSLVGILSLLLNSEVIDALGHIWQWSRKVISAKTHEGMYEVLECDASLELLDTKGHTAVYRKRERVRFLQDNIIAFQDQAWGDGEIFADYRCSPGIAVDRYREGYLYRVLISLRGTRNRGDVEEFNIERTIKGGFTESIETFQTDINHRTEALSLTLTFPAKRPPKSVKVVESHTAKTTTLGSETHRLLPDERWQVSWQVEKPHLYEAYIVRWEW